MQTVILLYWKEESIKTRIETLRGLCLGDLLYIIEKRNPLKQGLKHQILSHLLALTLIEKRNPLKQGLKLSLPRSSKDSRKYWKEESIKTRIETWITGDQPNLFIYWKEESIKTRIETLIVFNGREITLLIEKRNPLKQGLKHQHL